MPADNLIHNSYLIYLRGKRMFENGEPSPSVTNENWKSTPAETKLLWLGWMMGRAAPIMKAHRDRQQRERVMSILGVPIPLDGNDDNDIGPEPSTEPMGCSDSTEDQD